MVITKENLSDIREEFEKAHKRIDEDSRNDPPTEPFRSHYAARDILQNVQRKLKSLSESLDQHSDARFTVRCILANVMKDIGRISIFTEELSTGEMVLQEALQLIQDDKDRAQAVNGFIEILNQLGILHCNRGNFEESKQFLEQAKEVYETVKERDDVEPLTMSDLFGTKDEIEKGKGQLLLEKNHTLTLYYMAQVYGYMEDLSRSAQFCHLTLKRQLDYNDFEHIDWALNSATLSQYYFPKNYLSQARHLLAAASYMLDRFEEEIPKETNSAAKADKIESLNHRSADIARCWAKYAIHILSSSKERLCRDDDDDGNEAANQRKSKDGLSPIRDIDRFIGLEGLTTYEDQVTDEFCLTLEDAKLVMLSGLSWLNRAKEYYTKETEASQYAKIVQDIASLYKHLAFFDDNEDNQCKLYKRCVDQLEELDEVLNATYYQSICREIWYELGLTYGKMLDAKLSKLETLTATQRPTPHALNKINKLCERSIQKFQKFLESYKVPLETLEIPAGIDDADLQPILFAYFHIGRLYYKVITPDKRLQLNNVQNSFRYYHNFVKHCEQHETIAGGFAAEIGVCKEMNQLLPLKIKKLINEIGEP